MAVTYTDPDLIGWIEIGEAPNYGRNVDGYGGKIPTCFRLQYGESARWRRVYMMIYSNVGSAYIMHRGARLVLDNDTEWRLQDMR